VDLAALANGVLVRPAGAAPPVAFAAEELARYLGRIFGRRPTSTTAAGPPGDWLVLARNAAATRLPSASGVEWLVEPAEGGLAFVGDRPRTLLAAVYATLAAVGCEWSPDGEERIPSAGDARRALPRLAGRPAFARRAWASDIGTWHLGVPERLAARLPDDVAFVDWIAKSGGTALHFIRHANDAVWAVAPLVPELERRGLAVERGGHAIVELLPRERFAAHPEWFPARADGTRTDLGNLCGARPEALAVVRDGAARASGGADFHVWGIDVFGGGWCACAACAPLHPSEQALRVVNAVAEGLPGGARAFHLAYHDTLLAPRRVRPGPRVWAEFAPRERCYAHALDAGECETNRFYRVALDAHLEAFDGRVEAFEYYGDAILFGGCAVPLVDVIARDLECYRRAGVAGVACLTFGTFSLLAHGANLEAFARGVHDPGSATGARGRHAARVSREAEAAVADYLAALERAMAGVVRHGDLLLPPRDPTAAERIRSTLARLAASAPALRDRLAGASGPRVDVERACFDYTVQVLAAVETWLRADAGDTAADEAHAAFAAARAQLHAVAGASAGTFGAHDLEILHFAVAGMLRWPDEPMPRPFLGRC